MSKQNKVNPDHYKTGGRLTPDDLARERKKQATTIVNAKPRRAQARPRSVDKSGTSGPTGQ